MKWNLSGLFKLHVTGTGRVVAYAVAINGLNTGGKFLAWYFTGSHAMFSEAIHSLADTMNQASTKLKFVLEMVFVSTPCLCLYPYSQSILIMILEVPLLDESIIARFADNSWAWSLSFGETAGLGTSLWLRQYEICQLPDQRRGNLLRRRRT